MVPAPNNAEHQSAIVASAKIDHFGTDDLEITIGSDEDLEQAKPLFDANYQGAQLMIH